VNPHISSFIGQKLILGIVKLLVRWLVCEWIILFSESLEPVQNSLQKQSVMLFKGA